MEKTRNESNLPKWLDDLDPNIFLEKDYVVVDFETTNKTYGDPNNPENSMVLAVWHVVKGDTCVTKTKWGTEYEMQELVSDIEQSRFFVAHNAIFETGWLSRCGLDIAEHLSFCTQVAEYVLRGNRSHWGLSLKDCAARRGWEGKLDLVSFYLNNGICVTELPKPWVEDYCLRDVELTHRLFKDQRDLLLRRLLLPVTFCRNLKTPVLSDLEKVGMFLDSERVGAEFDRLRAEIAELEIAFEDMTGGINVKSAPQMREFIYGELKFKPPKDYKGNELKTPKGETAVNSPALAQLKATNKRQREFLELRNRLTKAKDAMSKYVLSMQKCCEEAGGLLEGKFNPCITQTHRLSSSGKHYGMQLQNIPRQYKRLFKSRHEGWLVGENDYSQLEYRCAVDMARDEAGMSDIQNEVDSHAFTASIVFPDLWEPDHPKSVRTAAKAHTFKPLTLVA